MSKRKFLSVIVRLPLFDVRISNVFAESNKHLPLKNIIKTAKKENKRAYNQRVDGIENGTFTPLIFGTKGSMGKGMPFIISFWPRNFSQTKSKILQSQVND